MLLTIASNTLILSRWFAFPLTCQVYYNAKDSHLLSLLPGNFFLWDPWSLTNRWCTSNYMSSERQSLATLCKEPPSLITLCKEPPYLHDLPSCVDLTALICQLNLCIYLHVTLLMYLLIFFLLSAAILFSLFTKECKFCESSDSYSLLYS